MANQRLQFVPILNEMTDLSNESAFIQGFHLYSSIYSGLPLGYFDLVDSEGDNFIDSLENLQVGVSVKFKLVTDGEDDDSIDSDFELKDYVIIKIEIIGEEDADKPSGVVRVWFGHKLFLYKDMANKAYPPLDGLSLIKQVLSDESRGFRIDIDNSNFDNVDCAKINRYKVMESDWEFLQKKVVPYCLSNKLPVFLYSNIKNELFLRSFKSMMNIEPKILFSPNIVDSDSADDFNEFKSANKTIKTYDVMKNIKVCLSNDDAQKSLRKVFYLEDSEMKAVLSGIKAVSNSSGEEGNLSKALPINYSFGNTSNGSSVASVRNHSLDDEVALLQGEASYLDSFLSMSFTANMNTTTFMVGETVLVYIKKGHWLNGKWVITSATLRVPSEDTTTLRIDYTVGKPTMNGKTSKTTLAHPSMLYKVEN